LFMREIAEKPSLKEISPSSKRHYARAKAKVVINKLFTQ